MLKQPLSLVAVLLALFMYGHSQAAISLNATRVVFEGDKKEAGVTVRNLGNEELLVQSWLDDGSELPKSIPFAITPPLAHMSGKSRQVLRVLFQGSGVPIDRESVFWINVQEVPKVSETENVLQLAIRQRIKLFYRPVGLAGSVEAAPAELNWQVVSREYGDVIRVSNPTKFHVSMTDLKIEAGNYTSSPVNSFMVAPGADYEVALNKMPSSGSMMLNVNIINDFGGKVLYGAPVLQGIFKLQNKYIKEQ
ncbi:Chaperone protein fimC precursor [Pseudomonas synxantha]|uniref:Chaperone protein fimC n=1 Tax=Pseudomonas synxantha TaxID=47883 RepID=A0A3G7UBT9_9PSED|nr:molecular chaperone [Pseudomonas synxantha]AZE56844.1 Chaperone protein fimC precursor [Pseudomonas synxantha]